MGSSTYTLTQLAEAVGMSPRNVRAYQARGLIDPPRRRGRTVVYDEEHRHRLVRVRDAVTQGVSLKRLASLVAEGRLEELEEVVRRLRPADASATIDLTASPPVPRHRLHPQLADHLQRAAPDSVEALIGLGVLTRDSAGLLAPADLGEPLHELFSDDAPVLTHALAVAAATASAEAGRSAHAGPPVQGNGTGGDHPHPHRLTTRVIDLVQRVQWAVVTSARQERAVTG